RRLAGRRAREILLRERGHLHVQVDAVEQRARDALPVARDGEARAAARMAAMAAIAARAGIHRRDELEARGKVRLPRRPRDGDAARLQRLAQDLEHGTAELR